MDRPSGCPLSAQQPSLGWILRARVFGIQPGLRVAVASGTEAVLETARPSGGGPVRHAG
jgi:hypothetical protein